MMTLNMSEPFESDFKDNPIPEKCRDCPLAVMTVGILEAFNASAGGPENYIKDITENCPGYDIAPEDATSTHTATMIEASGERYVAFSKPSHSQLARCAMKS